MAQNSKIEWTRHTANLWHGCTEVHAGCDNCYARVLSHRWGRELWGNDVPRMMIESVWKDLARYQKLAAAAGEIHRVFVGSMMDIFEKAMLLINSKGGAVLDGAGEWVTTDKLRDKLFKEIDEGKYPNLLFLFLTKRPSNINKMIPESWKENPPANVMFGTSPVDQKTADTLIPQLMQVVGKHFLSCEPLLGPIDLLKEYPVGKGSVAYGSLVDWVICGGESGHGARPMHPDWVRSIRDQCIDAGVPFLFKQWGEWVTDSTISDGFDGNYITEDGVMHKSLSEAGGHIKESGGIVYRIFKKGKKAAGRELDGVIYNGFPV